MNEKKPIIVFQSDFTRKEGAVSSMYGVVKSVDRELEIFDGTHEIPHFDTWSASYRLYQSLRFWPKGTVYVSVVDPGVGTDRKACVAQTNDGYFIVTPDNGTLTHIKHYVGIKQVREIDERTNRLRGKETEDVAIFHGRDVFAYTAARLASGIIDFKGTGAEYPVEQIVTHPIFEPRVFPKRVEGIFEIGDPNFGNLWTNIPLSDFKSAGFNFGDTILIKVIRQGLKNFAFNTDKQNERASDAIESESEEQNASLLLLEKPALFCKSFGYAPKGSLVIYNNEIGRIAVAVTQGNLCQTYSLDYGANIKVIFESPKEK